MGGSTGCLHFPACAAHWAEGPVAGDLVAVLEPVAGCCSETRDNLTSAAAVACAGISRVLDCSSALATMLFFIKQCAI